MLLHFFATYCEPCRPEMASLLLDCLDPDNMKYTITSKPIAVA